MYTTDESRRPIINLKNLMKMIGVLEIIVIMSI
jgi:hypothetical protein